METLVILDGAKILIKKKEMYGCYQDSSMDGKGKCVRKNILVILNNIWNK